MKGLHTDMSTATDGIPRTANLLACKQWWKVCFLYGDQEKYYRQIYGKAASQRLALSNQQSDTQSTQSNATDATDDKKQTILPTLFPLKQPSRRRSKIQTNGQRPSVNRGESIKPNSKVTVLDDPFLFGLNEHANLSEDSGIDNAAFENTTTNVRRCSTKSYSERELCNDLKINEDDLKNLHLSRNRNGLFHQKNQSFSFSEVNVNEKVDDITTLDSNGLNHNNDNYVALNE